MDAADLRRKLVELGGDTAKLKVETDALGLNWYQVLDVVSRTGKTLAEQKAFMRRWAAQRNAYRVNPWTWETDYSRPK